MVLFTTGRCARTHTPPLPWGETRTSSGWSVGGRHPNPAAERARTLESMPLWWQCACRAGRRPRQWFWYDDYPRL